MHAQDNISLARIIPTSTKLSGAWLNPLPISSMGLRMDNSTIRIAVGLRLGIPLLKSHQCGHCIAEVSSLATHSLSCRHSEGRHPRHASINNILHGAFASAKIPYRLEPSRLYHGDGKHPDSMTLADSLEKGQNLGLGCYLLGHFCPIKPPTGYQRSRCRCSQG